MDDTLADYSKQLEEDMKLIHSGASEGTFLHHAKDKNPAFMEERKRLITSQKDWWFNLPRFEPGFDILKLCQHIGFEIMILTKASIGKSNAWEEKVRWARKHISEDVNITITTDKSLMYGTVLVDDYPGYVLPWLKYRPRGIVIMPQHPHNANNKEVRIPRITLYDSSHSKYKEIEKKLKAAYKR